MSEIKRTRRYYLLKRLYARKLEEDSERIWQSKQEAIAGAALPAGFPALTKLGTAGYTTREDVDGASEDELMNQAGLTLREAQAVLAAVAAL